MVILLPFNKGSLFRMETVSSHITTTFSAFLLFTPKLPCGKEREKQGCPVRVNPHLGSWWPNQKDKGSPPTQHSPTGPNDPSALFSHRTNASEISLGCVSTTATSNFPLQLHWKILNPLQLRLLLFVFRLR